MRLAVFTNQFPTPVSTFIARDIRGLIESGIDVELFAIYPLDPSLWCCVPEILNENVLPRTKIHHIALAKCLKATRLWQPSKLRSFLSDTFSISVSAAKCGGEAFAKSVYVFPKAWGWAEEYGARYDHVLAYWGNYTATCAYLFHRLLPSSIPFSVFVHAGIDLFLHRVYLREKLLAATNIITCSDFNRSFIREQFADIWHILSEKMHVHYHGLDLASFPFKRENRSPKRVLAVGRLDEFKGFEYLLHALRELSLRNVDCELELVGNGTEAHALKRLTNALGIEDRVTFRSWVGPDEIPAIMSQAAVLVHPSSKLGDGVPNVIKEAMAIGTPVIGSNIAGIPELLQGGKHGILVPPKDVKALADAIQNLLADCNLRETLAASARKHSVEHFNMWRNGQSLADVLHSGSKQLH